jgi:hypothetical protein
MRLQIRLHPRLAIVTLHDTMSREAYFAVDSLASWLASPEGSVLRTRDGSIFKLAEPSAEADGLEGGGRHESAAGRPPAYPAAYRSDLGRDHFDLTG